MSSLLRHADVPTISADLVRAARRSETYFAGCSETTIVAAQERYLKFLALAARHPDCPLAPTRDIDWMWHLHMLHPRSYAEDCRRIFGDVLDHDGGFGAEPSEVPELRRTFDETAGLWAAMFGEEYVAEEVEPTRCTRNCQSRCWHACSKRGALASG